MDLADESGGGGCRIIEDGGGVVEVENEALTWEGHVEPGRKYAVYSVLKNEDGRIGNAAQKPKWCRCASRMGNSVFPIGIIYDSTLYRTLEYIRDSIDMESIIEVC